MEMIERTMRVAQPWLIEDTEIAHFGPRPSLTERFKLRIGDRPVARNLRTLYRKRNASIPPELEALAGSTYMITHSVGVLATEKPGQVKAVGYTATLLDRGSTVELLPSTSFRELFKAGTSFEAAIGLDGHAKLPADLAGVPLDSELLGAGAELKLAARAEVVGNLVLSVKTAKIQAVGLASSVVSWQFDQDEQPLVGDQSMVQTLLVPRGAEQIRLRLEAHIVVDPGLFSPVVRLEVDPLDVIVELS